MKPLLYIALLLCPLITLGQSEKPKKIPLPAVLQEVSGLYIQEGGLFWWHNDSGSAPMLYQTNSKGQLVDSIAFPSIRNKDWEDLTTDKAGRFYIGDFGNNCNCRKDLVIYIYHPENEQLDSIQFSLPDQQAFPPAKSARNFDLEAFFWWQDSLHLFSKNRLGQGNYYTKHYTLPAQAGQYIAQIRDSIYLKKRVVTGAAISKDGEKIALVAYHFKRLFGVLPSSKASVFYWDSFSGTDFFKGRMRKRGIPPFVIATQYESIDFFDEKHLYVASEQTVFIRPKAKRLRHSKKN